MAGARPSRGSLVHAVCRAETRPPRVSASARTSTCSYASRQHSGEAIAAPPFTGPPVVVGQVGPSWYVGCGA